MIKGYGKIMCFNDNYGIKHIFEDDSTLSLCREAKAVIKRDYYGKKTNILRRNIDAVTCDKCKQLYQQN